MALTNAFVEGLPALGQVVCTVWVGALTGIVDALINTVLDTAEKAIKAVEAVGTITPTHDKLIQGALKFKSANADVSQARSAFGKWVASKVCDIGALSKDQSDQIFDAVSQVNNIVITAATLPVGGGVLSGFRLASLPEMASNGANLLSQLPINWKDPPSNPKNAIGHTKHVSPSQKQQPAATQTKKPKRADATAAPTFITLVKPEA
ncbi:hypothetical protein AMS68_006036 [Peltaster fructicola]|uniref:Uncharacterized protein n=1 Tax=Peltaster fructicola TaxID=286661 RepID=A0A6H0Y0X7_9PEZI|nr:hypothetical protein AMS68_006036 [Peltaster fructicola]